MYKALLQTLRHLDSQECDALVTGFGMRDFPSNVDMQTAWEMVEHSWGSGDENTSRLFSKLHDFTLDEYMQQKAGKGVCTDGPCGAVLPLAEQTERYTKWLQFEHPKDFIAKMVKPTAAGGWDYPESYATSLYVARLMFQKARDEHANRTIIPFMVMLVDNVPHAFTDAHTQDAYPQGDPTGIQFAVEVAHMKKLGVSCNIFMPASSMHGLAGQSKNVCVWDHMATQLGGCLQEIDGGKENQLLNSVDKFMKREKCMWEAQKGTSSWADCVALESLHTGMPDLVVTGQFPDEVQLTLSHVEPTSGNLGLDVRLNCAIEKHSTPMSPPGTRTHFDRSFDNRLRAQRSATSTS